MVANDSYDVNLGAAQVFIALHTWLESFAQASDVAMIGCSPEYGIKALVVQIQDQETVLFTSPWHGLTCTTLE